VVAEESLAMPRFDIRKNDTTLDDLAPFKVLAVMCHPTDLERREEMLALLHTQTGHGNPRQRAVTEDAFHRDVKLWSPRGVVAGGLLLTRLQLHANNRNCSLNQALPLVSATLPKWKQPEGYDWSADAHVGHHPGNLRRMRLTYKRFESVAHLWTALIYGGQEQRDDIWPGTCQTLPTFLSYADCFLKMARSLPTPARDRQPSRMSSKAWVFTVPKHLEKTVALKALQLTDEQKHILNERKNRKLLL